MLVIRGILFFLSYECANRVKSSRYYLVFVWYGIGVLICIFWSVGLRLTVFVMEEMVIKSKQY